MTSRDPKNQGRDPIIFEAAIKLFNFYYWPTQLTQLIYTNFIVRYRDALNRLHVRLNSILLTDKSPYVKNGEKYKESQWYLVKYKHNFCLLILPFIVLVRVY